MGGEDKGNRGVNERVKAALDGRLSPDDLTAEEQEVWFDAFMEITATLTTEAHEHFANLRMLGVGVGLDNGGKLIRGPDPSERVKAALEGKLSPGDLSNVEQENWAALFIEKVTNPGPRERAVIEERRRKGLGVGLDEDGNLVRGSDIGERVKAVLDGLIAPSDLTEQEYDVWFDAFTCKLATPAGEAEEFFAELRSKSIDPDLIFISPLGFSRRDVIEYLNLKILPGGAIERNMLVDIVEDALNRLPEDLRTKFGRSTSEGLIVVSDASGVWFDDR